MMFLINGDGVPSEASIIQVKAPVQPPPRHGPYCRCWTATPCPPRSPLAALDLAELTGTEVVVGITGLCPYGIGACWGGANEALRRLERVAQVLPVPDAEASTATLFLADDGVPPLRRWREQFAAVVNGSYRLRGVEVTLTGAIIVREPRDLPGAGDGDRTRPTAADPDPAGGERPAQPGSNRAPTARTGRDHRVPVAPDRSRGDPGPPAGDHYRVRCAWPGQGSSWPSAAFAMLRSGRVGLSLSG